ncbi:outer membrane lipoprotein chaperone LolA [Facilibium subflavum]|uniref:outer membrane lipoprotein chaperone LolA n=1 Tax=Facilibium subflavum TaxID=2219058 RepID=UPI000E65D91A|nr:outer membrane lipoprotein chaperone LolA [Facilibium subflavum]
MNKLILNCFVLLLSMNAIAFAEDSPVVKGGDSQQKVTQKLTKAQASFFARLSAFKSMHADFDQVLKNPNQGLKQESSGQIWVSKPSYFKWQVVQPNKQLLVSNGDKLWNYDEDLEQVSVQSVPKEVSQAPYLLLLTGKPETLQKLFTIIALDKDTYRLIPKKDTQSLIKYIDVQFSGDALSHLAIATETGQSTAIYFHNISFTQIPKSTYQFKPPKGVDVLGA